MGIAQLPHYQVMDLLASGALMEVLIGQSAPRGDVWLIWPLAVSGMPRLRALADFLTEVVGRAI